MVISSNCDDIELASDISITGPKVIKLFSCSTQLSTKFQLLIKTKIPTNEAGFFFALSLSDVVFIMLKMLKCQHLLAF